jgi:hypothetical protein
MKNIDKAKQLDKAIAILEVRQKTEFVELKKQADIFYEELKPTNIIENAIYGFNSNPAIKSNVINSALSLVSGYISGKLVNNPSNSLFKKIAGYGLQYLITNFIAKRK